MAIARKEIRSRQSLLTCAHVATMKGAREWPAKPAPLLISYLATHLHPLLARFLLALRLFFAVLFHLPSAALPAAANHDASQLLSDMLLPPPRPRAGAVMMMRRRRGFPASSGGSGGEDTPYSDDAGVMSDDFDTAPSSPIKSNGNNGVSGNGNAHTPTAHAATNNTSLLAPINHTDTATSPLPLQRPPTPSRQSKAPRESTVLAVDIGGSRTKFLLVDGTRCTRLPPAPMSSA